MNPSDQDTHPTATSQADPQTSGADAGEDFDLSDSTILVVDDHEQNLELIQAYLEDVGCRVDSANDGAAALEEIDRSIPDIILLDIMMPRMSGYQVCERIKANPATRDIPVIMVTALDQREDRVRGLEAGADDFLTKPVNKLELVTRVKSLLRVRRLKLQLDAAIDEVRTLRDQNDA